jgi:hypothetical protein
MMPDSRRCPSPLAVSKAMSDSIKLNPDEERNHFQPQQSLMKKPDPGSRKGIFPYGRNLISASKMFISFFILAPIATANDSGTVVSWSIFHSWNPQQDFVRRGTIAWNKKNHMTEEINNVDDKEASVILDINNDQTLTVQDIKDMMNYGWYHVKLVPNSNPQDSVLGTVPACHVVRAKFKDIFEITLPRINPNEDHILSFAYTPLVSPLAPKSCDDYPALEDNVTMSFQSKTSVKLDTPGMPLKSILPLSKPPPGLTFMKRPRDTSATGSSNNKDRESNLNYDDPEPKPEPPSGIFGFFQRYWYVILPMVVMQFLAPPPEDPQQKLQQQGQGGQQQGVTAAAPPPSPAAMVSSGGGAKKSARRGKRN